MKRFLLLCLCLCLMCAAALAQSAPEILLAGETHGVKAIMDQELQMWQQCYHDKGMRHLFLELPCYTTDYLNLWMQEESDSILLTLYIDWEGTAYHSDDQLNFLRTIKETCPETIFHGTDVGHQYYSTGARYLTYLQSQGLENSALFSKTQQRIQQGEQFYRTRDDVYRENMMVQNFVDEFSLLQDQRIMGIYGSAHTELDSLNHAGTVSNMATQLQTVHGYAIEVVDLRATPLSVTTLDVGGKSYAAGYLGRQELAAVFPQYQYRDFYRLEDAYADFQHCPVTGDVLPYNNYPVPVTQGQVFVIDYMLQDGTIQRMLYRADGQLWNDMPVTQQFLVE